MRNWRMVGVCRGQGAVLKFYSPVVDLMLAVRWGFNVSAEKRWLQKVCWDDLPEAAY